MRTFLLCFIFLATGCATKNISISRGTSSGFEINPSDFTGKDACFILYNLKTEQLEKVYGKARCQEQMPACSTFKVPLAVMAFDSQIILDEKAPFQWDGKKRGIESWNQNHTASSWMRDSVIWVSQVLTRKLGAKKVQNYLDKFSYGNHDFSGGVEGAWLTSAPFLAETPRTSLKISGFEQIEFLKKLWKNQLPASLESMSKARQLTLIETSPNGSILHGKTGSGLVGAAAESRVGWFIGHLESKGAEYLVVTTFTDPASTPGFAGKEAREITKKLFTQNRFW